MSMGLQGKRAAADEFLSLYEDSSTVDSRPPAQGFFLKTRDFLQPLERPEVSDIGGGQHGAPPPPPVAVDVDASAATASSGERLGSVGHSPPGCFGAYGHVHPVGIKREWPTYTSAAGPRRGATARDAGRSCESVGALALWEEPARRAGSGVVAGTEHQQQWPRPSPFSAARGGVNGSFLRERPAQSKRCPAVDAPRSGEAFAEEDVDEGEEEDSGKREKPSTKEMTMKVDGSNSNDDDNNNNEQKPSTPRSKHSATEQRRRTKINDRFQILRDLIPHSDQRRDKASSLLEVIEYIQFLQERVQKYESSYPGWNQDNAKLMPWKNYQAAGGSIVDHSHIIKECPASSGFIYPADSSILSVPTIMSNKQFVAESEKVSAGLASKPASMSIPMQYPTFGDGNRSSQPQGKFISDSESMAAQPQSRWLRSPTTDTSGDADILRGQQELTADKGTASLSSLYSERLLKTLRDALQSSGVDLSQASISVQINLSSRRTSRPLSGNKDSDDPLSSNRVLDHSKLGSSREEPEQGSKRHKSNTR